MFMEKQFVTLESGEKLCYYEKGSGTKTVLLLCGLAVPLPIADLFALWEGASQHQRAIVLDRFGYGHSQTSTNARHFAQVVSELKAFCDALGIANNLVLVGHSLGSFHALAFAKSHPQLVNSVVLIDCYPFPLNKAWYLASRMFGFTTAIVKRLGLLKTKGAKQLYRKALASIGTPEPIIEEAMALCLVGAYNQNVMSELLASRADVKQVVHGLSRAASLPIVSICRNQTVGYSQKLKTHLPQLQICNVGKARHAIHHSHPEQTIAILKSVL